VALLLDTATLPPRDRAEAVSVALREARIPADVIHEPEATAVHARLETWRLGGSVTLVHRSGSGLRLQRTPRRVRQGCEERVAFTVLSPGAWGFRQFDQESAGRSAGWGMVLPDHAVPYEFGRAGDSSMFAVNVDRADLDLPADLLHAVAGRLAASPLHGLVIEHVLAVAGRLDAVAPGPATTLLGSATLDLLRALVTTAVAGTAARPGDRQDALLTQTRLYVRRHHGDPTLSPQRIARAHAISVRLLYKVWSVADESLASFVMTTRLDAARVELARPAVHPPTIASVARRCGFVDVAHFSRRFRHAFGMTPSEWRQLAGRPA